MPGLIDRAIWKESALNQMYLSDRDIDGLERPTPLQSSRGHPAAIFHAPYR